jgi:hypothetical protein
MIRNRFLNRITMNLYIKYGSFKGYLHILKWIYLIIQKSAMNACQVARDVFHMT